VRSLASSLLINSIVLLQWNQGVKEHWPTPMLPMSLCRNVRRLSALCFQYERCADLENTHGSFRTLPGLALQKRNDPEVFKTDYEWIPLRHYFLSQGEAAAYNGFLCFP
jgi:hypothetical protein